MEENSELKAGSLIFVKIFKRDHCDWWVQAKLMMILPKQDVLLAKLKVTPEDFLGSRDLLGVDLYMWLMRDDEFRIWRRPTEAPSSGINESDDKAPLLKPFPCTFCGNRNPHFEADCVDGNLWTLICSNEDCLACGPEADSPEGAITKWNQRK